MAETSKNKIYYNDNENSVADVLADMKKMAESTDEAIEKSKYNDAAIKKSISDVEKKQVEKNTEQDSKIVELQTEKAKLETELKEIQEDFYQNSIRGQASGEYIHVEDSSNCRARIGISGNHEQETSTQNENLLILEDGTQTLNGVTMTIKDGIITFNGTATASTFFKIKIKEKLKTGDYYHLAVEVSGSRTKNIALNVVDVEEKTIYSSFNGGGGSPFNLTNDEYITYRIWVDNGNVINNQIYKCMISKGSEKKKWVKGIPNMPSTDYPSEIKTVGSQGSFKITKSNKNLFNANDIVFSNAWTIIKNGSEVLVAEGVGNFEWKGWNNYINSLIDKYKIISYGIFSEKRTNTENIFNWSDGVAKAIHFNTIYTTKEGKSEGVWLRNDLKLSNETLKIIVGIGDISTYMQHDEQTYIMPTQKEMLQGDYFDFDNEEEVHVWGNVIVNGTETINKNSNSEFFSITKSMSQFDTSANAIKQSISNYGAGTTLGLGSGNTNNKYSFNASTIYLDCYNSNINTVEKLKVQLTKNNMKIYAKLATPQRIAFTEEQKAVAKELNNARTYKNVTNIYSTDEISPILSLDYAKDLETLLNNTQALAVNNASEGV